MVYEKKIKNNDIEQLKMVEETLRKNIVKLQTQEMNLKESIRTAGIHRDNAVGSEKAGIDSKIEDQKQRLAIMESNLKAERIRIDSMKQENEDRLVEIEKREQRLLNVELQEKKLTDERRSFEIWKRQITEELEETKICMVGYEDADNRLKVKEDNLMAREKNYVLKWKEYMDRVGELSVVEKEIQVKIEHLEALQKEVVHV